MGTLQAVTLVTGSILIGALGYAAVAIVSAPSNDTASGADMAGFEQPQAAGAAAAPGAAGAPAEEGGGGPLSGLGNRLEHEYDSKVYIYKTHIGDAVADNALNPLEDAASPGFDAGVGAVDRALPPFLQGHVPWLANYAKYVAVNNANDALGNAVEDQVQGAADTAKAGVTGGGDPAPAGAPAAAGAASASASGAAPATAPAPAAAPGRPAAPAAAAAPVQPVAVGVPAPAPAEIYAIRMGRFATVANAEQFAADLARRGIPAHVAMEQDGGRLWAVVRHGRFIGRGAAEGALREMQARGYGGTVVSDTGLGGAS